MFQINDTVITPADGLGTVVGIGSEEDNQETWYLVRHARGTSDYLADELQMSDRPITPFPAAIETFSVIPTKELLEEWQSCPHPLEFAEYVSLYSV